MHGAWSALFAAGWGTADGDARADASAEGRAAALQLQHRCPFLLEAGLRGAQVRLQGHAQGHYEIKTTPGIETIERQLVVEMFGVVKSRNFMKT